jgi:tetratricopeptide (TPR) repeat protein
MLNASVVAAALYGTLLRACKGTLFRNAVVVTVAAAALFAPGAAGAEASEEKTSQAKALWQEANAQYAVGEFGPAADKYQAAYKLRPDPALLYNAAQSYRLSGQNEKALLLYKNYVMFYPNARNVESAHTQITKLQEAIAAAEKAKTGPPTSTEPAATTPPTLAGVGAASSGARPTDAPSATASTPVPNLASTAPAASVDLKAPPPGNDGGDEPRPLYKKWWFWTAIGAAVVGGAVVAFAATRSSGTWNTGPDFGPGAGGAQ